MPLEGLRPGDAANLIARIAKGDREAFSRFYDALASVAFGLIRRVLRDPGVAEEVLQDVFWEVWRDAPQYDPGRGTPEAWLLMRAKSRAIDKLRSIRRRGQTFVAPVDEGLAPAAAEPGGDAAERAEDRGVIRSALDALPQVQREAIELAYYAGLTQTEIAERLRQPLGTVKTRIRLGLERLREAVKRAT